MRDPQALAAIRAYDDVLKKAGVLLASAGLLNDRQGARLCKASGRRVMVDGPFTDPEPLVRRFWLIQAKSRHEALAWAARCPLGDDDGVELRLATYGNENAG